VPFADHAAVHAGVEGVDVDAGGQPGQVGEAVQRAVEPGALIFGQVGDHVVAAGDPPEQAARAGQGRPADLVAVRDRHRPLDAGPPAQALGQQP
jgi:hypothetical protein